MPTWQIDRRTGIVALALAGLLIAANAALLKQNVELKSREATGGGGFLEPGDALPPLRGLGLAGEEVVVRYGHGEPQTLLLVFSPLCSWCTRNMPNWEAIAGAVASEDLRLVAVSTTRGGVAEYAAEHPLLQRIPVIAEVDAGDQLAYKLQGTPQTLVIGGDGVVERIWIGAFDGDRQAQAEKFFGTELPGVPGLGQRDVASRPGAQPSVRLSSQTASTGGVSEPRSR